MLEFALLLVVIAAKLAESNCIAISTQHLYQFCKNNNSKYLWTQYMTIRVWAQWGDKERELLLFLNYLYMLRTRITVAPRRSPGGKVHKNAYILIFHNVFNALKMYEEFKLFIVFYSLRRLLECSSSSTSRLRRLRSLLDHLVEK